MLGYRTTFEVDVERSEGIDADDAVETLLREGFEWLKKKRLSGIDDLEPWIEKEFTNGARVIYGHGKTPAGDEYAKLVFFDRPQESGQWVTTLLIGRSAKKQGFLPLVSVEIDVPEDPDLPGRPLFSNRPWLVKNILDGYFCLDRDMRTSDDPILVSDEEQVEAFLRHLEDKKHRGLIIACGTDGTVEVGAWRQILDDITTECAGQATVFLLDPEATRMVNERVSSAHALTPYALRTFKPGVVLDDPSDGLRHRVLTARALLGKNRKELAKMFGRISRTHSSALPPDPFMRRLDTISGAALDRATLERKAELGSRDLRDQWDESFLHGREIVSKSIPGRDGVIPLAEPVKRQESAAAAAFPSVEVTNDEVEMLRLEIDDLRARFKEWEHTFDKLQQENRRFRATITESNAQYQRMADAYIEDLDRRRREHESEVASLNACLEDKTLEVEIQLEEKKRAEKELRTVRYHLEIARGELRRNGFESAAPYLKKDDPYEEIDFLEWEELVVLGPDVFPHLILTYDPKAAEELGRHGRSLSWLRETCEILAMLDEYAAFRTTDDGRAFNGGLHQYLRGGAPAGARLISADRMRDTESNTTQKMWGGQRRFKVPKEVDPSGERMMLAHVEIQRYKSVSPRLYFEDRTADLGKVVIGYIGRHLTNTQTA